MKYTLSETETLDIGGVILHRVLYTDGTIGGWIESESNLSQEGNARVLDNAQVWDNARVCDNALVSGDAWVYDSARVFGNAQVSGDARVYDNAWVRSDCDWMIVGPIGSRNGVTTIFRTDSGISVVCGCFLGSLEQFEATVAETHGDGQHGREYRAMIEMVKIRMGGAK